MALGLGTVFVVCLGIFAHPSLATKGESVSVETDVGTFVGYVRMFKAFDQDLAVRRFFGIPYAEPPVGDLRFQKPVRKAKLKDPYDATEYGPTCIQQILGLGGHRKPGRFETVKFSEDCLYLNIYAPDNVNPGELLPVVIYIYGGGFVCGSPVLYNQDILSAYGRVVAVTFAYRLSIWGFLSTGDEELPGNYGLWDQRMAIQWVHENIANFGGDPKSVTIFGTSAGGASVIYQGLYPGNRGLIHRVSALSGTVTCPWAINKNPLVATKRLGKLAGCVVDTTTKELADCLKSKTTDELWKVLFEKENNFTYHPYDFVPSVDGDFIPESPQSLFRGSSKVAERYLESLASIDVLVGVTSGEGLFALTSPFGNEEPDEFVIDRDSFENKLVPDALKHYYGEDSSDAVKQVVIGEYTDWDSPDDRFQTLRLYVRFVGDSLFYFQAVETAQVHARLSRKKTYMLVYDAVPSQHLLPIPSWADTAQHVDDMATLLGYDLDDGYVTWTTPYSGTLPDDWEIELSKFHITLFTNFAKTGDPNRPVDVTVWSKTNLPEYDVKSEFYFRISRQMTEKNVGRRFGARAVNFWLNVLPSVMRGATSHTDDKMYCERDTDCKP